ncbi:hypothetical protein OF83DRAFT_1199927 [Amylostereum chailletii]|nr:hypothetical protein OF83DRAFT_1199927 [Amylostereum chailletii]
MPLTKYSHGFSARVRRARCSPPAPTIPASRSTLTMSSEDSLIDRLQSFVSDNKRGLVISAAAAAVAAGGVAYYVASSRSGHAGDEESQRKKDKRRKKGKKTVKDSDGPILEERKPAAEVSSEEEDGVLTEAQIATLPTEERVKRAASLKLKGNKAYQRRDFANAIEHYTRAIAVTPTPEPVYFSNRAACYVNLNPPQLERVVEDCDAALALDRNYIKALNRRASALEGLGRLEESLRDYTAATILDKFQNESAGQAVERVLKKLATDKATEILSTRERHLPSFTFVSAYFAAFRPRPLPALPDEPTTGDNTLILALQALAASDYPHAMTLTNEAIEQGLSDDHLKAEALNIRGTFKFLTGDTAGGRADFEESVKLAPTLTQTWVKLASVHMELGDPKQAFECFESAIKQNEHDPDIYYHRGQVLFIMNEYAAAAQDYTKSTELDDSFVFSHIQLAVAQYKSENLANSMATFRRTLRAFPERSEPQNY